MIWGKMTHFLCRLGLNRGYLMCSLLCFMFLMAACRWPVADIPKLAVRQAIMVFDALGNMQLCRVCRGKNAKNNNRGISIAMGKSIVAFLKPNFFVSHTKSLFLSFFGNCPGFSR